MFNNLITFPIESDQLQWSVKQVVRDFQNNPTLFFRIKMTGTLFPHRALEPYIKVGKIKSNFVTISSDGLEARGYFDSNISNSSNQVIEFGYGDEEPLLRIKSRFSNDEIQFLDFKRLKVNPINIDAFR
jgi:hypothetical protein